MHIVLLILIPLVISGGSFVIFKTTITWKEFLLQLGGAMLTLLLGWQLAKWGSLRDTEHLNGRITRKDEGTQHCCHCHDVCDARNKKGSCTSSHEVCSHSHDYHWELQTTVGEIDVEDCSGYDDPPDTWVDARVGEPAAIEHSFNNYLLADPDSLFVHETMDKFVGAVPSYPKVFKLYRVNHVIGQNVEVPNGWQDAFREMNADLGAPNQVDITVVLTNISDPTYAQALEAKWLYGPKNSLNIVMGVGGGTIQWVRVVTFSRVEMLKVRLRDQLQTLKLDDPRVLQIIRTEIASGFKRTHMADFEYLARTAQPKGWALAMLYVFSILLSIGLTYLMDKYDVFGDERAFRSSKPFGKF
jgi:hypothetical protein